MIKIIDCFPFYNELDMLKYRLSILNDIVDYFILVESSHTYAGHKKDLYYELNKNLYEDYKDKIIYVLVDDFKYIYPNIDYTKNQQWVNEHYQRNCITKGINMIKDKIKNNDIIIISDLDEIPDPNTLKIIKKNNTIDNKIYSLKMDLYYYNLNCKLDTYWYKSYLFNYETYIHYINKTTLDNIRETNHMYINNGGWHMSYFGDEKFIKNKIENFSHQEHNYDHIKNNIFDNIKNCKDIYNRNLIINYILLKDNTYLPPLNDIILKYVIE